MAAVEIQQIGPGPSDIRVSIDGIEIKSAVRVSIEWAPRMIPIVTLSISADTLVIPETFPMALIAALRESEPQQLDAAPRVTPRDWRNDLIGGYTVELQAAHSERTAIEGVAAAIAGGESINARAMAVRWFNLPSPARYCIARELGLEDAESDFALPTSAHSVAIFRRAREAGKVAELSQAIERETAAFTTGA